MKKITTILLIISTLTSCSNTKKNNNSKTQYTKTTQNQTTTNYNYIISKDTTKAKKNLLILIDPKGNGTHAISIFNDIINYYPCTIIALNNVQNNTQNFAEQITKTTNTAIKKLDLKPKKIFLAGFSGGARMAYLFSSNQKINGLLMCGAGIPLYQMSKLNFPIATIAGLKDFNFAEQYYPPQHEITNNKNILNLIFEGEHKWPPKNIILQAITFLFAKNNISNTKKLPDYQEDTTQTNNPDKILFTYKKLETNYKIANTKTQSTEKNKLNKYKSSPETIKFFKTFNNSLEKEKNIKNKYLKFIQTKSAEWWKNEINNLKKQTKNNNKIQANMYSRILGFIDIVAYTLILRTINNPTKHDKYLKIYEYINPENPYLWFFKAAKQKFEGNTLKTNEYLQKAYKLGFNDKHLAEKFGL